MTSAAKGSSVPFAQARQLCERALASGLPAGVDRAALRDLAALAKRQRDFSRACALWHELAGITSPGPPEPAAAGEGSAFLALAPGPQPLAPALDAIDACIELAMHCEHRARDPHRALDYARHALDALRRAARAALLTPAQAARLRARLDRRLARLQRKLNASSAPLSALRVSASSFPPQEQPEIARTPLRRASQRTPAESNGHGPTRGGNPWPPLK